MAFLAIKDCEKELDLIERQIDERLPAAITKVNEGRARQLLASLKCITDLERIGDLVMSVALRVQSRSAKWPASDTRQLVGMSVTLRTCSISSIGGSLASTWIAPVRSYRWTKR